MTIQTSAPAFSIPVRVYYEDTDAGGVVYYANYLRFFERCRTEWVRAAGCDQSQMADEHGIGFVAREASCKYLKPARLDDQLTISLQVEKLTRVRAIFRQVARRGDVDLVTGKVEIACVNLATMTPTAIPGFLYSQLEALK